MKQFLDIKINLKKTWNNIDEDARFENNLVKLLKKCININSKILSRPPNKKLFGLSGYILCTRKWHEII